MNMSANKYYIIEPVPANMLTAESASGLWYCHKKGFPNLPVFGSIGTKHEAAAMCKIKNQDGKVHYR